MGDTEISWTHRPGTRGRTWNVAQGCSRISAGCQSCYAERLAARFAESGWSKGLINLKTRRWNGEVRMAAHKLADPLRWREPSTVFVNSMSDLFHEGFTNEQIFGHLTGLPISQWRPSTPSDPDDLRRCRLLLEQVPAFRAELPRMAEVSRHWAALVARWDEVCALMDEEAPEWRECKGGAPRTYALMNEIERGCEVRP